MLSSIKTLGMLFELAAEKPNTFVVVAAKDFRRLRVWLLAEALDIYHINRDLQSICQFIIDQRCFKFTNGSVIQFNVYKHYNDAKSGMMNFLVYDYTINCEIITQLLMRCSGTSFMVE